MGRAWLAGGRARNKAARLPLPGARAVGGASRLPARSWPGDALAPGTLAGGGGRGRAPPRPGTALLGDNGPPPRLRAERYKGRGAPPGNEPGVRKVKTEERQGKGEGGGGRGSPRAAPPAVQGAALSPAAATEAGAQTSSHSTPAEREEGSAHKEEWNPRPPLAPGAGMAPRARAPTVSGACPARAPRGPESARGAPHPDSPTALCPSSWRNLRRLGPSGGSLSVRLSDMPLDCSTSHWLADGLAAPPLCLRRCRHRRAPQ